MFIILVFADEKTQFLKKIIKFEKVGNVFRSFRIWTEWKCQLTISVSSCSSLYTFNTLDSVSVYIKTCVLLDA